jgi:pimeloyl-ACP methyl ester carboxylesterase
LPPNGPHGLLTRIVNVSSLGRSVSLLALASVIGPLLAAGCSSDPAPPSPFGDLRTETCPDTIPSELANIVSCATLEVPAVHDDPSSPKLSLRVFASAAPSANAREPVVYLAGGPGGTVRQLASAGMSRYFAQTLNRAVLLLEQRGAALSRPALDCKLEAPEKTPEKTQELLRQCVETYKTQDVRLEAFNTIESAHDVEDLRRAMGVEKVIVWGGSYGALLAGAVAREHPQSVAGLVLESSVLGDRPYRSVEQWGLFPAKITTFAGWLKSSCAASSECAQRYPGLDPEAEIAATLEQAKLAPVEITAGVVIDSRSTMNELLFRAMYAIPNAVLFVRALWAANHGKLAELDGIRIRGQSILAYLRDALDVGKSIASTPHTVVNCYDDVRQWTDEGFASAWSGLSDADRADIASAAAESRKVCSALPPPSVDPARFSAPVSSTIPTLFLGGRLDPVTPIEWAMKDAERFPRSQVVVSECLGHGVVFGATECYSRVLSRFADNLGNFSSAINLGTDCVARRCEPSALGEDLFVERALRAE